jgi:hypothetical protein
MRHRNCSLGSFAVFRLSCPTSSMNSLYTYLAQYRDDPSYSHRRSVPARENAKDRFTLAFHNERGI